MNFIVIGCGRVGSQLAYRLFKDGHQVCVVDRAQQAFSRLDPEFRGRTTEGDMLNSDTLRRAGVETADGVAVATNDDALNAVIGHAIRTHYPQVKQVLVRNYDPAMREMQEAFGLQIVSSTAWGAERLRELLIDPEFRAVFSAGNGEVELYELLIESPWQGRSVANLMSASGDGGVCVALTRAGRAQIPSPQEAFQAGDILTVSATLEGIKALRQRLQLGPEA
jgi:trk system potassium uptake protein TrkA